MAQRSDQRPLHDRGDKITLKAGLDDKAQVGTYTVYVKVTTLVVANLSPIVKQVTLTVTNFVETANGTNSNDTLRGTEGDDIINGLGGNDKIYGLGGNDTLNGGTGKDKLYGGAGQDTFVFDTPVKKGHFDHIEDFKASDDTIQISLAALKAFKVKGPKTSDVISKKGSDDGGKPTIRAATSRSVSTRSSRRARSSRRSSSTSAPSSTTPRTGRTTTSSTTRRTASFIWISTAPAKARASRS